VILPGWIFSSLISMKYIVARLYKTAPHVKRYISSSTAKQDLIRTVYEAMAHIWNRSISLLLCLIVMLPSFPCQKAIRPFWRYGKPTKQPEPTLPPIEKNPEFYKSKLNLRGV
jgi:hypothetical protein